MELVRRKYGVDLSHAEFGRVLPWGSLLVGAGLLAYGLARRSRPAMGAGAALAGGGLLVKAAPQLTAGLARRRRRPTAPLGGPAGGIHVERAIAVNRPVAELYRYWRHLVNLPSFMHHLEAVTVLDERRSHWVAKGPAGIRVSWEAEIVNEIENQMIAWRSLPGSEIEQAGSVRFRELPADRGSEIHVELRYDPPAGRAGVAVARLFGRDAEAAIREDLRRFKQLMEAGEVPTTTGQPAGAPSRGMALADRLRPAA